MMEVLARNWWLVVLRGVLAILFGLAALFWPALAWLVLVTMFGIYVLVDGVIAAATGLARARNSSRWWVFLLEGLLGIIAGVLAILFPNLATFTIILLMASWAIITGVLEIAAAIRLRREITNEWLLGLGGLLSILLGVLLIIQPAAGALVIIWMVAIYAILFGALLIALGFRLRGQNVPSDRQPRAV